MMLPNRLRAHGLTLPIPTDRALCARLAERGYLGPEHAEDVDENHQTWVFGGWTEAGRKWLSEKLEGGK